MLDKEFQFISNPWVDDINFYFTIEIKKRKKTVYRNFVNNVLRKKRILRLVDAKGCPDVAETV